MIDLAASEEQRLMLESAGSLLLDVAPLSSVRTGRDPAEMQRLLAQWGWFGFGLHEEQGGMGLGVVGETLLAFEAGRFLLPPRVLAGTLAARLCVDEARQALLAGEARAALAFCDVDGCHRLDAGDAGLLVVFEADDIWLAPAHAFEGGQVASFDETVAVERGDIDRSSKLATEPCGRGRLLVAAMLAGIARASCDLAVAHAGTRKQFGQPIGAFQAIKHMCADMGLRAFAAEAQVRMAAVTAADAPARAETEIAAAALTALRAARDNGAASIQAHGGIGFTAECMAHFYLKRAHLLGTLLGGIDACRMSVLRHADERST